MGGTLLQKQGDEWVVIGYHSKRLPKSAKNFGITELELTGLLVNIHGFMQLLHNRYFEVLVDHKVIEYMIKSKTESPTTRLKTLLLKLSEYTIDLKYQKGSEMHTSDALSRLHNFTDTPDQKDIIPLNFLQHLTPHYIEHSCYIVGLGPNCKFIDLLFKRSVLIFIKISSFIVSLFQKLFYSQTDTLTEELMYLR